MADPKLEVTDLLDRYVTALDERRFDDWLALFTDDCYYTMILREDHLKDNNMVAIGEDKQRLAGRIEVGQGVQRDITRHLYCAVIAREAGGGLEAAANFAVFRKGAVVCTGRYEMKLVRRDGALRLSRCTAVLDNDVIHGIIYLPV
jgi:3-phenylpropionate/cinnamic acid dioxygenase small subunit